MQLPRDLHRKVKETAKRNGLTINEYCERVFRAATESDLLAQSHPLFLERWEKFLAQVAKK